MKVEIGHGSGGKLTRELIENLFLKYFSFPELTSLQDASYLEINSRKIAMTTDSYVVRPYFFPGGDIGKLSISGTINDLTVSGAVPEFISVGFILEEGLAFSDLEKIVKSMADTAKKAGIKIAAGDTKVVEKGKCDGLYVNTTGIGKVVKPLSPKFAKPGDLVIVTGFIGDHGIAISLAREEFEVETGVLSDCAPLNSLLVPLLDIEGLRWMRDPTRGGLATVLIEFSEISGLGVKLYEEKIPVREEVRFVCDMLGYDPLYLANEGKAVVIVDKKDAEVILEKLRSHALGKNAEIIGEVTDEINDVRLITSIGGERRLELLEEDPLPRIC
ncbi:hydrogenase expression/formation protein HypE [Desulfurobacterium thermolithotrophum DSM 11699]|uniref:Hydrogenase expression/formation protein HypE n=1 Tax=Desulfurobacterium thermolithotrophum (strain DSM 11699 / BSA) TaxID=868864 RepID=F0S3W0_DESTD|nr:hydrogenase expression/formation protein HypE [Desulfurobacterium thermolithotrophum]ADY73532.1 hydrogenase expression/formation protein HypE [Desulfurobacterium thermolithotrophum DSM 11699]